MHASTPLLSRRSQPCNAGAALLLTLVTVVVLSVLLVGFMHSMRLERQSASAHEHIQRTKLISQGALSHAIDVLRTNIPDPARLNDPASTAPARNWIVNPGRLTLINENGTVSHVPLHSGELTSDPANEATRDADSVDLNQPLPGSTVPAITYALDADGHPNTTAARPPMRVRWVPVFRNPASAASVNNPLIGRYAFWVDDESSKINFNTALGKPAGDPATSTNLMHRQMRAGFLTPTFSRGGQETTASGVPREWSLGNPRSVNLDVLFADASQIDAESLMTHSFFHGFSRYPEAIVNFVDMADPQTWFQKYRYQLTPYSRSPEFNVFGRPRFAITYIPLSLEAGPLYQQPFIASPGSTPMEGVLHLNSLFGSLGFDTGAGGGATSHADNIINRANINLIVDYLRRLWPGYNSSFVDKYGEREAHQIALNLVMFGRMANADLREEENNLNGFSRALALRSTSVCYSPPSNERPNQNPERYYWTFEDVTDDSGDPVPMLPQMPPPYITEIRVQFKSVRPHNSNFNPGNVNNPDNTNHPQYPWPLSGNAPSPNSIPAARRNHARYLVYRYQVEYSIPPNSPAVALQLFCAKMDYFKLQATGGGANVIQQFGPSGPEDTAPNHAAAANWNHNGSLQMLTANSSGNIGPPGNNFNYPQRRVITTLWRPVGNESHLIPNKTDDNWSDWNPTVFYADESPSVAVKLRFRAGMTARDADTRPRQMIPLGEKDPDHVLDADDLVVNLTPNVITTASWEIADPHLSGRKDAWIRHPGEGTPGEVNTNEATEDSEEIQRLKFFQRSINNLKMMPDGDDLGKFARGNEFESDSAIASPGYIAILHTGMQSGAPYRTLSLDHSGGQGGAPPDWLLLDLIAGTYPMQREQWKLDEALPDTFSTISYMNSTAGAINLNTRPYPNNPWFQAPQRIKPLEAVFRGMVSDEDAQTLASQISQHQTDTEFFSYRGEVAAFTSNFSPLSSSGWDRETILRNLAGVLTTRSNTFGVWGVAQTITKARSNTSFEQFEPGDRVLTEKRFYALVERHIWPGNDGMPGNAHVNPASGRWDRLANQVAPISTQAAAVDRLFELPGSPPLQIGGARLELDKSGTYALLDGPERVGMDPYSALALGNVVWQASSLEDAVNPPQPLIKYRIVYFKYLDQ